MTAADEAQRRFSRAYALANVGAFICFIPLIGLLLPQMTLAVAPADGARLFSWVLLAGAIGASVGNIAAGTLSDFLLPAHGSRLPLVALGLTATLVSFSTLALATTPSSLVGAFILFQLCFNLLFAPFNALATDYVPDAMKGRLFGLLSLSLPLAQLMIFAIVALPLPTTPQRLLLIAMLALVAFVPLLLSLARGRAPPLLAAAASPVASKAVCAMAKSSRRDFAFVWMARLLVQCAAVAAGSYLYLHLTQIAGSGNSDATVEQWMGHLSLVSLAAGLTVGVALGRWSDGLARRRPFLLLTSLLVGLGCALIGTSNEWVVIAMGYGLFAVGLTGFLTVDGAVVAQIVGRGEGRGANLGLMNLTNTLPALIIPALMLTIENIAAASAADLFVCVATGAVAGALLMTGIRTIH